MTRRARAGNTQKHQKMPEDPTPWEEFSNQHKEHVEKEKEKKFLAKAVRKESSEAASTSVKEKIKRKLNKTKNKGFHVTSPQMKSDDQYLETTNLNEDRSELEHEFFVTENYTSEIIKKRNKRKEIPDFAGENGMDILPKSKKRKVAKKFLSGKSVETFLPGESGNNSMQQSDASAENEIHKLGKKKKNIDDSLLTGSSGLPNIEEPRSFENTEMDSSSEKVGTSELNSPIPKNHHKGKESKSFFDQVKANRLNNGILLLPKPVENRLYRLKKALRRKGFPGSHIKEVVRKARREAELEYQKTLKTCLNCRETGHILENCPKVLQDKEQSTGICFKCGSIEHKSYKCHIKTQEFPFAKCFICQNTGHLSKNCPENKRGIYPKGGQCNLCGSILHLRKDCPKSSNQKSDEDVLITAGTISEMKSVDDEIFEERKYKVPKQQKGPKIVKF